MKTPVPLADKAQEQDVSTLVATVQGTIVLGDYTAEQARTVWQAVCERVERWLDAARPLG